MKSQKKLFTGGIDSDTTDEFLPEGLDRYRLNVRALSSDNSTIGAIETVNGNTLVAFTLPSGINTVIGSREDLIRKKVYYFVYNTLEEHSILEYDAVTNLIAKVFQSSILNFDIDHLITGINFIKLDDNNHLLYWTDYFNEPRKINIEKGKYFMSGDFVNGYSSPFNPENIYRIKQPMLLSPTAVYVDDSALNVNRLDKKLFQFKVQYVYDDNEVSSWSPISKTVFPLSIDVVGSNNAINVTVDTGIEIVKRVRIAVKMVNSPDFSLVVDLDKYELGISSNSTYVYSFTNSGNYIPLEINESIKLFDNVPKLSQAQEIIKPARIVDGNIVEGFDPVNVDLKLDYSLGTTAFGLSVDYATVTSAGSHYTKAPSVIISGDGVGATAVVGAMIVNFINIVTSGTGYAPGTYPLTFIGGNGTGLTGTYTADAFGVISNTSITNAGTGYTTPPQAIVSGGGGTGATFWVSFGISSVLITNGGTNYTAATASFSGGVGTGLAATAVIGGSGGDDLISITLNNAGTGYTQAPIVGITSGTGSGAIATLGMEVESVVITNGGSGYTSPPAVGFPNGGGSLAAGTAVLTNGVVTSVTITNGGTGYIVSPEVTFTGGGGLGVVATTTLKGNAFVIINGGNFYATPPAISFNFLPTTAIATLTLTGNSFLPINALKRGGIYFYGIVYYDHGNRSGLTNINDGRFDEIQNDGKYGTELFIPFYTEIDPDTSLIYGGDVPSVSWSIYNEAPSWATHYQIVRVKNSGNDRYIQFAVDAILYLDKEGVSQTFGNPTITQMKIKVSNIYTEFKTANPGSILVYDFIKGDRIRFIKTNAGVFVDHYIDLELGGFDVGSGNIYVVFPPGVYPGTFPDVVAGYLFEIYQPELQIPVASKLTFEIGCGNSISYDSVNNKYIHDGDIQNEKVLAFSGATYIDPVIEIQLPVGHGLVVTDDVKIVSANYSFYGTVTTITVSSATITRVTTLSGAFSIGSSGTIVLPSKGNFIGGDTFYRVRRMPYSAGVSNENRLIEDANYSDLFLSPGYDYGRPNRIDPKFKQITRESTIYYSENFIPETFINGLSTVYDTSFESYESKYGGIYKLYNEDQSLIMFQELKVGNIYVEKIIYNSLSLSNTVGATNVILSPQAIYYAGEFGIGKNPESFFVYATAKYFMDVRRGSPIRLSIDGLTPIGETAFMHNYFTDKCRDVLGSSTKIKVYGVYDIKFKEYVVAFSSGVGVTAETLAFNERANQWSTFYSYIPEGLCSNGIDIISFKNGGLWKHNTNLLHGNFYGVQYQPEVWVVFNSEPSLRKILLAISQETNAAWEVYEILTPNGQKSSLKVTDFQEIENNQYADVLMDENTPNIVVSPAILPNAIFLGDPMRDRTFLCKFRYTGTDYNKLFALNLNYIESDRNT